MVLTNPNVSAKKPIRKLKKKRYEISNFKYQSSASQFLLKTALAYGTTSISL